MGCQVRRNNNGQIEQVLAPNGKESILYKSILELPEINGDKESALLAWAKTYTPSFKAWFGNSKVVDENGEPLLVYHGTDKDIKIFDKTLRGTTTGKSENGEIYDSELAFFFSDNPDTSFSYSVMNRQKELNSIVKKLPEIINRTSLGQQSYNKLREEVPAFAKYVDSLKSQGLNSSQITDKLKELYIHYKKLGDFSKGGELSNPNTFYNEAQRNLEKIILQKRNILQGSYPGINLVITGNEFETLKINEDGHIYGMLSDHPEIKHLNLTNIKNISEKDFDLLANVIKKRILIGKMDIQNTLKKGGFNSVIMPSFLSIKSIEEHDFQRQPFVGNNDIAVETIKKAMSKNKDGVVFKNILDPELGNNYGVFEPNQIKSVFNSGEFSTQNDNIYYQLTSNQKASANKELDTFLLDFLKPFGVITKDLSKFKDKFGLDAISAVDVLNKVIYLGDKRKLDTVAEEASHIITMLLGREHPLIRRLYDNIEQYYNFNSIYKQYMPIYNNLEQVKKEAIDKLLASAIVDEWHTGNWKTNAKEKALFQKIIDAIKEFFVKFIQENKTVTQYKAEKIISPSAREIAKYILNKDQSFLATPSTSKEVLNYNTAVKDNDHARFIINNFIENFGCKLTGSLAIAGQGKKINRPSKSPIHDIDFVAGPDFSFEKMNKYVETLNGIPTHFGIFSKHNSSSCYAFLIPKKGYTVQALSRKEWGGNMTDEVLLKKGEVEVFRGKWDDADANLLVNVDFFTKDIYANDAPKFASWQSIYFGKMILNPIGEKAVFFSRTKDLQDYREANPVNRDIQLPEFTYYQLEASSKLADPELDNKIKIFLKKIGVDVKILDKITNVSTELSSDVKKAYKSNTSTSIRNLQQNPGFLPVVGERGVSIYNSSNPEEVLRRALLRKEDSSSFQGFLSQSLETLFNNKDRNSRGYRLAVGLNIVNRLFQETNSFNGRMVQSFFQNKLGSNKLIRIENDSNRPTFYANGQGIYININGLGNFIDRFNSYEDFLKGIELILSEELIHHTALNLSTKEEMNDLRNSLNIEELDKNVDEGLKNCFGI